MALDKIFSAATEKFSLGSVIRSLKAEGYDYINHATNTFANCLCREGGDDVVVVNIDPDWAPAFYKLCAASSNPYLPKIHEFRMLGDNACFARMERLVALDHINISEEHRSFLNSKAKQLVSYIRGEPIGFEDDQLKDAALNVLKLSQNIYSRTNGRILPVTDIKESNVFMRPSADGHQLVFGDPLFPGSGGNIENKIAMNEVYRKFGLPDLPHLQLHPSLLLKAL